MRAIETGCAYAEGEVVVGERRSGDLLKPQHGWGPFSFA
jgi:hypothetical protein